MVMDQATLELKSASAGVASVAVALVMEQATLELKSSCASDGVASVAVALLLVEQEIGRAHV